MRKFLLLSSILFSVLVGEAQCENYTLQIFSYVMNGGPTSVTWEIEDLDNNNVIPGGTVTFSALSFQQTITICLEPGCYNVDLEANAVLNQNNFIATVMSGETILYPTNVLDYGGDALNYNFCTSVDEPTCEACFTPQVSNGILTINNCSTPVNTENTSFTWTFGDGSNGDGPMPIHTYADNGVYEVCVVMIVTVENVISCISDYCSTVVVEGLQEDDCPGQIWSGVGESCATMNFEIGSFVEGESVTWFPGDESGAVQGGHFFSHTYENPGLYTVCAFYTSLLCPDGVELCTNIFVESCGNECPNEIFASQIDCDSFLFQIPGNEGEVNWNFGDNTEENSSNSADHTYLQDGVYVITAHYTSPGCNEGITLVATVEVNCGNDCTSFILPNYNCQQGTTTLTVVGINENANTTWWWGNNEVNTESSSIIIENTGDWIFVCAWSEAMQLDGCPEVCDEIYVGCENACSLNVDILQESCEVLVLSAAGVPNPENVMWSLNGENFNLGSITTFPLSPGANQICAWYEGELCSDEWCETFQGCNGLDCPDEIWSGAGVECGVMNFEIGSFVEGESVNWFPGDDTGVVEGGHFFSHTYAEPGTYLVCAVYTSPNCEGVELCTTIVVEECGECSEVSFSLDSFVGEEGPGLVTWSLSNSDGLVLYEGMNEYSLQDPWYDQALCLENGCYTFNICSSQPFAAEAFDVLFSEGWDVVYSESVNNFLCYGYSILLSLNSDCVNEECTEVVLGIDSYQINGGAHLINWFVYDEMENLMASGTHEYSENNAFFDTSVCLPDGCYVLVLQDMTTGEFSYENLFTFASAGGMPLDLFQPLVIEGQFASFGFSLNGDCVVEECQENEVTITVTGSYINTGSDMFNLTLNYENFPLELEGFQMCSECPEELNYTFCLPNGCYEVDLETEFPISAEFIMIQAFLNGIEIPDAILELSQGDDNGTLVVGLNSDCFDSVNDQTNIEWELYPNPSSNMINVVLNQSQNAQLRIFDMTGKLVIETNMTGYGKQLDIASLESGLYSVVLTTSNSLSSKVLEVVK